MIKLIKQKIYKFLIWSQKWTKTDMVYLAKGSFWLTLGQIVSNISGLLLSIVFANLLPKEIYGSYRYILSIIPILSIPTLSGIDIAIIRSIARGHEGSYIKAFKTKLHWGVLGGIASLFLSGYYYFININYSFAIIFLTLSIFIPLIEPLYLYTSLLTGKKDFKTLTKYNVIILKLVSLVVMTSTLLLTKNLFFIVFAYILTLVLLRTLFFFLSLKKYKLNKETDPGVMNYGKHLSLMSVLGIIAKNIDKILIFHFLGASQLAIYSFALLPLKKINGPLTELKTLFLPKLSQRNISELKKTIPQKMLKMFILIIPITITYILIVPYFYKIFIPQYSDSIIYAQIIGLTLLFLPRHLMGQTFVAHTMKKALYVTSIFIPILKIFLFLFLLPKYKIFGIILTLIIIEITTTVMFIFFFKEIKDNDSNNEPIKQYYV